MSQDLYLATLKSEYCAYWHLPSDTALATSLPDWKAWGQIFAAELQDVQIEISEHLISVFKTDKDNSKHWTWYVGVEPRKLEFQPIRGFVEDIFPLLDSLAENIGSFVLVSGSGADDMAFPRYRMEKTL